MKRMSILLFILMVVLFMNTVQSQTPKPIVVTGYLVDHMCGKQMAKQSPEKADAKAARHTKECALDENCKASGFGVVSKGHYFKLDPAGDMLAETFLTKTTKEDHIRIEVRGTVDGEILKVGSLKPAAEPKILKGKS